MEIMLQVFWGNLFLLRENCGIIGVFVGMIRIYFSCCSVFGVSVCIRLVLFIGDPRKRIKWVMLSLGKWGFLICFPILYTQFFCWGGFSVFPFRFFSLWKHFFRYFRIRFRDRRVFGIKVKLFDTLWNICFSLGLNFSERKFITRKMLRFSFFLGLVSCLMLCLLERNDCGIVRSY